MINRLFISEIPEITSDIVAPPCRAITGAFFHDGSLLIVDRDTHIPITSDPNIFYSIQYMKIGKDFPVHQIDATQIIPILSYTGDTLGFLTIRS